MSVTCRVRLEARVPKRGCTLDECEDQIAVSADRLTVAVSDGASHSLFAGRWARCVAERFCEAADEPVSRAWLGPASRAFYGSIDAAALPWHAALKLGDGAFATLCGLRIDPEAGVWEAVAVGDSALAVIEPGRDAYLFPPNDGGELDLDPWLLGSLAAPDEALESHTLRTGPVLLHPGRTRFVLVTDALVRWLVEEGVPCAIEPLLACETSEDFAGRVAALRADHTLQDDDCTLVIVEVDAGGDE